MHGHVASAMTSSPCTVDDPEAVELRSNLGAAVKTMDAKALDPKENHDAAMVNARKMAVGASAAIRKEVFAGVRKVVADAATQIKDREQEIAGTKVLSVEEAMDLLKRTGHTPHDTN